MTQAWASREIGEVAAQLRNAGDSKGAQTYLENQIRTARSQGNVADVAEALQWLSTTLWFDEQEAEGIEIARQALIASEEVAEAVAVQSALTLAMLLTSLSTGPDPEAEVILTQLKSRITASFPDSHHEEMRLQRLQAYHQKDGNPGLAAGVRAELSELRARGGGFTGAGVE